MARRLEAARAGGALGLIATTDWSFSHARDWGSPKIPSAWICARSFATRPRHHPPGLGARFLRRGELPRLTVPNMVGPARWRPPSSAPTASGCRRRRPRGTTSPGCRAEWVGPFMLKGVIRVDDAKRVRRRRA